ncbi:meiosis-specific transcription factor ndt80 [Dinochytrium kinnereticum]|nr:meiosis-specific transcription factor ndt80 [Dinochytrium kinnereticum]
MGDSMTIAGSFASSAAAAAEGFPSSPMIMPSANSGSPTPVDESEIPNAFSKPPTASNEPLPPSPTNTGSTSPERASRMNQAAAVKKDLWGKPSSASSRSNGATSANGTGGGRPEKKLFINTSFRLTPSVAAPPASAPSLMNHHSHPYQNPFAGQTSSLNTSFSQFSASCQGGMRVGTHSSGSAATTMAMVAAAAAVSTTSAVAAGKQQQQHDGSPGSPYYSVIPLVMPSASHLSSLHSPTSRRRRGNHISGFGDVMTFFGYNVTINPKIDRGFFFADNDWTCYRRNYFQMSCAFSTLDEHGNTVDVPCCLQESTGRIHTVTAFSIGLGARVATSDKRIDIVQHTAKRDKGPQNIPLPKTLMPGGNPYEFTGPMANPGVVTFERLQFKSATASSVKRKQAKQYYVICVDLIAITADNLEIPVACIESLRLVVRGRSPSHYNDTTNGGSTPTTGPCSAPVFAGQGTYPRRFSSTFFEGGTSSDVLQSPVMDYPSPQILPNGFLTAGPSSASSVSSITSPHPYPANGHYPVYNHHAHSSSTPMDVTPSNIVHSVHPVMSEEMGQVSMALINSPAGLAPMSPFSPMGSGVSGGAMVPNGFVGYHYQFPGGLATGHNPLWMRGRTHSLVSLADSEASYTSVTTDASYSSFDSRFDLEPGSASSATGPVFGFPMIDESANVMIGGVAALSTSISSSPPEGDTGGKLAYPESGVSPPTPGAAVVSSDPSASIPRRPSVPMFLQLPGRRGSLASLRPEAAHPLSSGPQPIIVQGSSTGSADSIGSDISSLSNAGTAGPSGTVPSSPASHLRRASIAAIAAKMSGASPVASASATVGIGSPSVASFPSPLSVPSTVAASSSASPIIVPSSTIANAALARRASMVNLHQHYPPSSSFVTSMGVIDSAAGVDFRRSSLASINEAIPTQYSPGNPSLQHAVFGISPGQMGHAGHRRTLSDTSHLNFVNGLAINGDNLQFGPQSAQVTANSQIDGAQTNSYELPATTTPSPPINFGSKVSKPTRLSSTSSLALSSDGSMSSPSLSSTPIYIPSTPTIANVSFIDDEGFRREGSASDVADPNESQRHSTELPSTSSSLAMAPEAMPVPDLNDHHMTQLGMNFIDLSGGASDVPVGMEGLLKDGMDVNGEISLGGAVMDLQGNMGMPMDLGGIGPNLDGGMVINDFRMNMGIEGLEMQLGRNAGLSNESNTVAFIGKEEAYVGTGLPALSDA